MKPTAFLLAYLFLSTVGKAQCDTTFIDHGGWTIPFFDSEGATNGHAIHRIDGDSHTLGTPNGRRPAHPSRMCPRSTSVRRTQ